MGHPVFILIYIIFIKQVFYIQPINNYLFVLQLIIYIQNKFIKIFNKQSQYFIKLIGTNYLLNQYCFQFIFPKIIQVITNLITIVYQIWQLISLHISPTFTNFKLKSFAQLIYLQYWGSFSSQDWQYGYMYQIQALLQRSAQSLKFIFRHQKKLNL
ncbi:transmembrane protein, putative (macronuclear) [Tetrahymena thermophila SB210]|uniref:Transmembrane protein, putative n=1 Tax=Tetrahymena thermophila (strain SB210) TaxID=312017 RepID=W7XAF5_TETTS|nr:transmembrane protein, putative [Tetrahymena thermophila SB210]EWS73378.1 transmembrane protein, putative [Tetrahymena thermophila SB210]|eukprot:XP_012654088.1 transmembrane protein, putative [Tetrahymena thermophila SB210]